MADSILLTPELNEALADVFVAPRLEVPGRTDLTFVNGVQGNTESPPLEDLSTPNMLAALGGQVLRTFEYSGGEVLAVADKINPHALFDFMAISGGQEVKSGLADHAIDFRRDLMTISANFALFVKDRGYVPVVGWSYDPHTVDRPSGQGEGRFHAHYMARTHSELEVVDSSKIRIADIDPFMRRRLAEESATVMGLVLYDQLHGQLEIMDAVSPLATNGSSVSFQARIAGGWSTVEEPEFIDDLATVNNVIENNVLQGRNALLLGSQIPSSWERPSIVDNVDEEAERYVSRLGISDFAAQAVVHYVTTLRQHPYSEAVLGQLGRDELTHRYPLAGLSYTTCITDVDGEPTAHFRFNMFSDLGGAGTSLIDGVPTKIKKNVGLFSAKELVDRVSLQQNFMRSLPSFGR